MDPERKKRYDDLWERYLLGENLGRAFLTPAEEEELFLLRKEINRT